jgi:hypothetical protein
MQEDQQAYFMFTAKSRLDKSINSLLGIVEGIAVDKVINEAEVTFLNLWVDDHRDVRKCHPFNELLPVVAKALEDAILSEEERQDILWLCDRLRSTEYYDMVTADVQRLHGVLGGIVADGVLTADELTGLSDWLEDHAHLNGCWPYDEVDSMLTKVMADKKISKAEHRRLMEFFAEFTAILDTRTIRSPRITKGQTIGGLCAVCPKIEIPHRSFCFTGESLKYTRRELSDVVLAHGGRVLTSVSPNLDYLIIGANGNSCWAYACYGRKVEKAVELRKQGARLLLVHENDFHDAVADANAGANGR